MAEKFDLSVILRFVDKSGAGLAKFSKGMRNVGKSIRDIGTTLATRVSLPIVALGGFALKSAIDIESAFVGVQKTVNATAEEFATLKSGIKGLALKIPISAVELFSVAEAAGQLGVKVENIVKFTDVMAKLGVTTNLSATEAATGLARFANVMGTSQGDFDRLGSVIVALGNSMATTESEILEMARRLSGAGRQAGLSEAQVLALAGSLSSVGIQAESGGSAFSVFMKTIGKEVGTGSDKMRKFALVAGKSVKDFETAWKKNAANAMLDFIGGLKRADEAGINTTIILDDLGFKGLRVSDALLRASSASDKFKIAQETANTAWIENNALQKEAELRFKTTASQLKLFKNEIDALGESFGDEMLPGLREILTELKPFITQLKELSPELKQNILKIAGIFAIGGPILLGLGAITVGLGVLLSPIGLVVLAVAGIGTAITALALNWDEVTEAADKFFNKLKESVGLAKQIKPIVDVGDTLTPGGPRSLTLQREDFQRELSTGGISEFFKRAFTPNLERATQAAGGGNRPQAEITVKVESANGTSATVTGIKQINGARVKVENKSLVGPTLSGAF